MVFIMVHELIVAVVSCLVGGLKLCLKGLRKILQLDGLSYCCHNIKFKQDYLWVGLVRIVKFN